VRGARYLQRSPTFTLPKGGNEKIKTPEAE